MFKYEEMITLDYIYQLFIEIIRQILSERGTSNDNRGEETNEE